MKWFLVADNWDERERETQRCVTEEAKAKDCLSFPPFHPFAPLVRFTTLYTLCICSHQVRLLICLIEPSFPDKFRQIVPLCFTNFQHRSPSNTLSFASIEISSSASALLNFSTNSKKLDRKKFPKCSLHFGLLQLNFFFFFSITQQWRRAYMPNIKNPDWGTNAIKKFGQTTATRNRKIPIFRFSRFRKGITMCTHNRMRVLWYREIVWCSEDDETRGIDDAEGVVKKKKKKNIPCWSGRVWEPRLVKSSLPHCLQYLVVSCVSLHRYKASNPPLRWLHDATCGIYVARVYLENSASQ